MFLVALGSVVAAAWMSMAAFVAGLPPENAAFGKDGFALEMVAVPLSLMAFAIAWPLLHFGLRETDLRRSLPLVVGSAWVVTPCVAYACPPLAPVLGLFAGGLGVLAARRWFRVAAGSLDAVSPAASASRTSGPCSASPGRRPAP